MSLFQTPTYAFAYNVIENAWAHDLVFLNGNLASSRWWMPTVDSLKAITPVDSKKGRLVFIELPGCGDSPQLEVDLNPAEIASQYLKLLESLSVTQASVIGHSTGGLLASLMMAERPSLFKSALLLDPVGAKGIQFDDSVLDKYEEMKANRDLTAAIIGFTIHNCDTNSSFFQQVIVEDTLKSVRNVGSRIVKALRGYQSEEKLRKVTTPTTILFGEHDILLPKADAQQLTTIMANAQFIEVPGHGHCLNIENPVKMATYLKTYVS